MMKTKTTKRALLTSALALLLCVSMLVGSTFAWFTDSVTSSGNKIVAGTLDIQLLMDADVDGTYDDISNSTSPIFGEGSIAQNNNAQTLWEPGKTQVAYLAIKNNGNLDLKYTVGLNVQNVSKDLYEVMEYAIVPDADENNKVTAWTGGNSVVVGTQSVSGDVELKKEEIHYFALAIHMDEEAGNKYQGGEVNFDLTVLATQLASEFDSFDNQYDKDATYPVSISIAEPVTVDGDNKTDAPITFTFQDNDSKVSEVEVVVPVGTQLEAGAKKLVLNIDEADTVNEGVAAKLTSEQAATTYEISLEGVAANNDKEIEVSLVIEKGLVDVVLYHNDVVIPSNYDAATGTLSFATKGFSPFTVVYAEKVFAEGNGTKEDPYVIEETADLLNITKFNHEYKYYKVADGVKTLDMSGVGKIKLNGSFDGNGVVMNNLTTALFETVGKVGVAQDIKISNLTANVHTTDGRALVRNIYNPGTTTFENVALHGYIEGQYNMGSFYNYGTANAANSDGADYTVSFVNATSDVTLVCTSGNIMGGMLGHGYEGADYTLSINMDANSKYTGKMYTTNGTNCYQVMAMCSHTTYILNGVETSRYTNTYPSAKLAVATPAAAADGYYVAPVEGVDHYTVSLEAQLTAYDEDGVKIPNMAGLTWSLGKETITSGFEGKIFDLITSAEIVNDESIAIGYEVENGGLKVYTGRDVNYASGWITLIVTQYDAEGSILATGNVRVHTFVEP